LNEAAAHAVNSEHHRHSTGGWLALAVICALLRALGAFTVTRSRLSRASLIKIDSNGTTRLGPLPLANTNLRDAAFTAVGHLNSGTVSVSAASSAKLSDVAATVAAMKQAGVTSVTFRVTGTNK
jgi:biopolymer transport protein ExbD